MIWTYRSLLHGRGRRTIAGGGTVWTWRTGASGAPPVVAYLPRGGMTGTW